MDDHHFCYQKHEIADIIKEKHIKLNPESFKINDDLSIDVDGDVKLTFFGSIPLQFRKVNGNFDCSSICLPSLRGAPIEVRGDFLCYNNDLISLEYCPKKVGNRFVVDNEIKSYFSGYESHNFEKVYRKFKTHMFAEEVIKKSDELKVYFKYHSYYEVWKNGCINKENLNDLVLDIKDGLL